MLLCGDPRCADDGSHAVGEHFHEWTWIFMRKRSSNCPRCGRMFRWERCSTLKELPSAEILVRTLPPGRELQGLDDSERIDRRLAAQKSRLSLVIVMRENTKEVESGCASRH